MSACVLLLPARERVRRHLARLVGVVEGTDVGGADLFPSG